MDFVEDSTMFLSQIKSKRMASKSKLTKPPEWWKHLKWCKRVFWKKERQNEKREAIQQRYMDDR